MKKSILKRMAEEASARVEIPDDATSEPTIASRRHSSPVISNVGRALSHLSEDSILSLDPSKIYHSPYQDRFKSDNDAESELEVLKLSIATEGQKIPVLVRPHPSKPEQYQLAYGHRRLAAVKEIMAASDRPELVKIKAYVRELTDRQLIEEQAIENGLRENLTWIELAMWAAQLKEAGFSHRAICPVLGQSEAAVSHLFRVTSVVPSDIIYAIGRAKLVGRPKWTAFAETLKTSDKVEAVRRLLSTDEFKKADGVGRMSLAMSAASDKATAPRENSEGFDFSVKGRLYGRMKTSAAGSVVTIPKKETQFAQWLAGRMPELIKEYEDSAAK